MGNEMLLFLAIGLLVWAAIGAYVGDRFRGRLRDGAILGLLLNVIGVLLIFTLEDRRRQ